jgi:hypothetical protein
MPDDRTAGAPVGVHPESGALSHGAAGQEHRRRLAQHLGDVLLELGDRPALAVQVGGDVRVDRGEQLRGPDEAVAEQGVGAGRSPGADVVIHRASLSCPAPGVRWLSDAPA